jgi:ABC-type transport system involved in cytochrome c biogenesis permease subunit
MIAYSLLAFAMLNGVTAILLRHTKKDYNAEVEYLQVVSNIMLYPAVFLLAIGIFIGAVWANISWGRYWGWDPKEVWALITMLVYSAALHSGSLSKLRQPMVVHKFMVVAFFTVLITYFGVNLLLGGMHSYA